MFKLLFIVTYLFFNIQICHSCMRMIIGGGGDVTVPPRVTTTLAPTTIAPLVCSTCSQATIIRGSGVGMDQPITQMQGINANGCRTIAVTCTSNIAGTQVNFFWYDNGADRGTSTGTTTITRNLVCNANGDLILTENGVSAVVDQVECISAPVAPVCSTCAAQVAVITNSGIGKDEPIMQVAGTDANGCRTVAVTCTADTPGKEIFYFWKQAGADRGTSSATTTITRNLVCNENAQFVLTEPDTMAMGIVDQVECVSATVAPVCSTCAAQVAVITNSGIGKDEPIMQVAGTDANGCRTVAVTCTADTPGKEIFYFWKQAGADRGTSSAITTITRNLVCNENAQFVLTEPDTMAMGIVDQVECISATVAPVCSTCAAQVAVITNSGIGKDEPIMQVAGTDANGCRTVAVTCTADTPGKEIFYFWKQAGADRGSSSAITTITRNLVCNENAQFVLTEPDTMAMGIVDQVECISATVAPVCSTCAAQVTVITNSGIGKDEPIMQVAGTDANGCRTVAVTCTADTPGKEIFYFWKQAGADRGTSSATTTITRNLVCNENAQFVLTEPDTMAMGIVDQVECISATVAPVCSTCAAQVAVITFSGIGKDEPIMQVAGTDANGCRTVDVTCTAQTVGTNIIVNWKQAGADRGTSTGTTAVTRNLVCNENAQFVLNDPMGIVDQVECTSPICETCTEIEVIMDSGIGVNQPITQMIGKNANGCNTVTVTCTTPNVGEDIYYFWDRGTSSGVTTVTRVLTCNSDGELELTEGTDTGVVTQVECVTAG